MPQLDVLLKKAMKNQSKEYSRGNRPDRIASGQNSLPQTSLEEAAKAESKWSQSEAKVEPQLKSKWSQSEAKVEPINQEKMITEAKVEPQLEPQLKPKWSQSGAKVEPKTAYSSLVGLQQKTLLFIYDCCRFSGSKSSPPLAIQNLADGCNSTVSATKKALQRLEEKHFLTRPVYKDGRGGWTIYQLADETYAELFHNETRAKVESNRSQSGVKVGTELEPQLEPTAPSSSSLDINKLTTNSELLVEWQTVDFSAVASIGFREPHIRQVAAAGLLTPETLQESINAFAFDLEVNGKAKDINGSALNYFMGILRKGPYAPAENYETPEARQLREYLEAQKRVVERHDRQVQDLKEIEFKKWQLSLSSQVIDELTPLGKSEAVKRSQLLNHFTDHIWSQRLAEIRAMMKEEKPQTPISTQQQGNL